MFCKSCGLSFARYTKKSGTTAELIEWVAERARRFERKRQDNTDDKLNKVLVEFAKFRAAKTSSA